MNYEGLIGDPREPNSNSLLVCVKGLQEGPLYCSAQLAGCCFNGRWEINGDLMTVGRTQRNNRVLVQRGPSTLVSQGKCLHGCTYTDTQTQAYMRTHLDYPPDTRTHWCVRMHAEWKWKRLLLICHQRSFVHSSAISAPRLIMRKTNWANFQPANPPMWQKKANLCIGDVVCEE